MAAPVRDRVRGRWPAPGTIHGQWTASDLDTLPDDGLRYEIIDGTLIVSPAPLPFHQVALGRLHLALTAACPPHHHVLLAPTDWQPDRLTSVQPDLLVVRSDDITRQRLAGTPVLLVEVASRSSRTIDRTVKFERYARAGVPQYWIVDPGTEESPASVEVYDLIDGEHARYHLQVRATGDETAAVTGPVVVTVTPAALVAPPT